MNKHQKIAVILYIIYSIVMLLPTFIYWYGTLILGNSFFNETQIGIVNKMAVNWFFSQIIIAPLCLFTFVKDGL